MKALAPAPSRATASVVLGWGVITIPVSLYTATEETKIARQERTPDGNPVGRQPYDKVTGEPVDRDTVRKVAVHDGVEVELTDEEIAAVTGTTTGVAEILGVVPLHEIGTFYLPEKLYQARPQKGKKGGESLERAFALLTTALARRGQAAIVKVALRGSVARYAALTPDGYFVILHHTDAVREALPMPSPSLPDAELDMADTLLDAIGPVTDELTDQSSQAIGEYVAAKAAGGASKTVTAVKAAPVGDLMASLAASIEASKAAKAAKGD